MKSTLCILDYSGTLSPGSVTFGCRENLLKVLNQTSLASLGIDRVEILWEQIINQYWQQAGLGYITYVETILRYFKKKGLFPNDKIRNSAVSFVNTYLAASNIHKAWEPLLKYSLQQVHIQPLIASDHYPEMDNAILNHLKYLNIKGQLIPQAQSLKSNILPVATSSSLGYFKDDIEFWQKTQKFLNRHFERIIVIDDFGANEHPEDAYTQIEWSKRITRIEKILTSVFNAEIEVFPFIINLNDETAFNNLVKKAEEHLLKLSSV